jgi:hypothetical protein
LDLRLGAVLPYNQTDLSYLWHPPQSHPIQSNVMKRASVICCLGIWCASCALSFIAGRSQWSTDAAVTPSEHRQRSTAALPPLQTMREQLQPSAAIARALASTVALGQASAAELVKKDNDSAAHTHRLLDAAFALSRSDPRRAQEIRDALAQLALSDPLGALAFSDRISSLREAQHARSQVLSQWASYDPNAALAWAATALTDVPTNLRNSQLQAILHGFAQTDPEGAFNYANALDDDSPSAMRLKNRLLSEVIETQIRAGGLQAAQHRIALMPDNASKQTLQRELVSEWAAFDPHSAAAYVTALGGDSASNLTTSLITEWANNDPPAAANWLNALPTNDPAFAKASAMITREWTRYDLAASSEWLNSLPASPELDHAVAAYTSRAAQEDPATAMSWAESINHGGLRTRMMQKVAGSWKNEDPDAFAAYLDRGDFNSKQRKLLESAQTGSNQRRR